MLEQSFHLSFCNIEVIMAVALYDDPYPGKSPDCILEPQVSIDTGLRIKTPFNNDNPALANQLAVFGPHKRQPGQIIQLTDETNHRHARRLDPAQHNIKLCRMYRRHHSGIGYFMQRAPQQRCLLRSSIRDPR